MAVPGTWNILGYNLPDYGWTEGGINAGVLPANTTFQNPNIASTANTLSPIQNVANPITSTPNPAPGTQNAAPAPAPTQSGGGPGYAPSFPGQTVSVGGITYRSNSNGTWSVISGGDTSPWTTSQQDLDAIYKPSMDALAQQEAQYRGQLPAAEQAVGTSYDEGLSLINKNLAEQEQSLQKQQAKIDTTRGSALAQARQLYNELAQKYGAMFGSRTSAGPAAMEILGRETQKQFGAINQGSTQATQDVSSERTRLQSWVSDQTANLQAKKRDAIAGIQNQFAQGLASIAAQRGALESAKAQARFDLLQQAQAQVQQVQQAATAFQQQLAMFQQQKQATLDQMQYAKQLGGFNAPAFQPSQMQGTTGAPQVSYDYVTGKYKNQYGQTTDQYGNVQY